MQIQQHLKIVSVPSQRALEINVYLNYIGVGVFIFQRPKKEDNFPI